MKAADYEKELALLKERFEKNMKRHKNMDWAKVSEKLGKSKKIDVLCKMEESGGEPDVIEYDVKNEDILFCDCSAESPVGRRGLCYDRAAFDSRKENKPNGNVIDMANEIGAEILSEAQYRKLQEVGEFDKKTSSWILTPKEIRVLGGAVFCDRRYDHVFMYHNGADSYYAARGFRVSVRV